MAAALDGRYLRNVEALRRVQPPDLRPSDITARLGAPWVPAAEVELFSEQVIGITTRVRHTVEIAAWSIDRRAFAGQAAATSELGTARRHAGELLDDALHSSIPTIWDIWRDETGEHREVNAAETEAAKEKLAKIKAAFEGWVWTDPERADRLTRVYNDTYNNLVPHHFDGSHLTLPGASSTISFRAHQKRGAWRIVSAGGTYLAHTVGSGKTFLMAAAIMEQKRLGLVGKALMVVPGHCLAQASREFLQLYPTARILVADETNFVGPKRARFLARAATANWDCIVVTHSAFKFIAAPAAFERGMVQAQVATYDELLGRLDGDDRITRKRIESMKEKLEAKLEALATRKDNMLTIAEMGIDQIVVDEAQEFRKLSFGTNMSNLKGVQPDSSQRAWDLYVKSRFVDTINPGRALVMASGTPITNTLAEMFTLQRFLQPDALAERGLHQFDAWAATFGSSTTELELQPSGTYKPVTRFAEFVNVADLMAMFRSFADVVSKHDLRGFLKLLTIEGGQRQIVTAEPSRTFKWYQRVLAKRISAIEQRRRRVEKGDDILLSVITDGRHAAIDLRFVLEGYDDEAGNKLNALVGNVHRIWAENSRNNYLRPDGSAFPVRGAAQMVFSDLGTLNVEAKRGFSAYRWIKDRLVACGVPAGQIAFMQDHKKSAAKQRLFADVNAGRVTVLIGSSETMGTGVNAQLRLKALHHLDVPWLPSQIEQREGRIERQGNQNDSIGIYAYATLGSTDATMWQNNERKQRFIDAALSGDRSIRRIEDAGNQVSQFAMAKAIASGDPRLMQKAGLEAEIARLQRQEAAHFDDQHAVRSQLAAAGRAIAASERRIGEIEQDLAIRTPTKGDLFAMTVDGKSYTERPKAGGALLNLLRNLDVEAKEGDWVLASIGGFRVSAQAFKDWRSKDLQVTVGLDRTGDSTDIAFNAGLTALGLVSRLEHALDHFEAELGEQRRSVVENTRRVADYGTRIGGGGFALAGELAAKLAEMAALEDSLAKTTEQAEARPTSWTARCHGCAARPATRTSRRKRTLKRTPHEENEQTTIMPDGGACRQAPPPPLRSIAGYGIPAPLTRSPPARAARGAGQERPPAMVPGEPARGLGRCLPENWETSSTNQESTKMEIRTVDPRKLKANPNNPRKTAAGDFADAQLTASIKAIGLVQPPLVKEDGKKLVILAGHRRTAACVAAGLSEIQVLVMAEDGADTAIDPMRSISENLIRADMGQVDRWRAMQALAAAGWNEAAIAEALGMTTRNIAQARLLANICPAMLDQMAKNDLPEPRGLRIIAAATTEEQAEVWKQHKPKRGHEAEWGRIAYALNKPRLLAKDAKFGADEATAFDILWQEDLFAPAGEDSRSNTQVDAFLAAQQAWLEANLPEGGIVVEVDEYGRPRLPKGAQPHYGRAAEGVLTACCIDSRTGIIGEHQYTMPQARSGSLAGDAAVQPERKARPDLTQKGSAIVGDLRTDALHQALREKPIDDDQLIGMLVLALGGRNVTVKSGVTGFRGNALGHIGESLTQGGVLTRDLDTLRQAAREALVEVLSCRDNYSASGMGARHAGAAIDADAFLPNMATEAFLPSLSRAVLEACAGEHAVAVQARVRDTRAAMLAHFANATFVYPGARFAPTEAELETRRNPASMFAGAEAETQEDGGDDAADVGQYDDGALGDESGDAADTEEDGAPERDFAGPLPAKAAAAHAVA